MESVDFVGIQQQMLQVDDDIGHLLELAKDPKKYGELIETIDSVVDKVDRHVVALQNRITEELDRRAKEYEAAIKLLDDPLGMVGSKPPNFLSSADIKRWNKLATKGVLKQQLASFKKSLIYDFKDEVSKQLQIEKLTEQNITIRRILDKIRRISMV